MKKWEIAVPLILLTIIGASCARSQHTMGPGAASRPFPQAVSKTVSATAAKTSKAATGNKTRTDSHKESSSLASRIQTSSGSHAVSSSKPQGHPVASNVSSALTPQSVPPEDLKYLLKNAEKPLDVPTYEGSGQAMHPKVLYFKEKWNGWAYWMSNTPYPYTNDRFENPSIVVSQDGKIWTVPHGLKNPVIPAPSDVAAGGHNSDPQLVMHGDTMEMWYRYNPARKNIKFRRADSNINQIYRVTSKNGVEWSKPELILNGNYKYYSPDVLFENGVYQVWFSDSDGKLHYTQSSDLTRWTTPETVKLELTGYSIWHQDMIKTTRGYEIVFCAYQNGHFNDNTQCLYYAFSHDGRVFSKPVMILRPTDTPDSLDNQMIYRSSILDIDGRYTIYYSGMDRKKQWHIFLVDFNPTIIPAEFPAIGNVTVSQ